MSSDTYGGGSWSNPDKHARPPRPVAPAVEPEAFCEAPGPDGWTCDLKPHSDDRHWAEGGPSWGSDWAKQGDEPLEPMAEIHALAQRALDGNEWPDEGWASWEKALRRILEISRG